MSLEIQSVADKGDAEKERLILRATADTNVSEYVVIDTTFNNDGDVSNKGRHAYKFPSKEIKRGDWIALYTKKKPTNGISEKIGSDGVTKTHFFYWGRDEATVWNEGGDHCTLLKVVQSKAV